ncbi:pilin [Pseudomonas sp. R3.Fl]|nr:pilin [Pseudomonas sp. R3.Fl]
MKTTAGLQADIAIDTAEAGAPAASAQTQAAAAALEGKYFNAGGVVVTATTGAIAVTFASGALAGQTLTITPTFVANTNQISRWRCTGLTNTSHIPSGCR